MAGVWCLWAMAVGSWRLPAAASPSCIAEPRPAPDRNLPTCLSMSRGVIWRNLTGNSFFNPTPVPSLPWEQAFDLKV